MPFSLFKNVSPVTPAPVPVAPVPVAPVPTVEPVAPVLAAAPVAPDSNLQVNFVALNSELSDLKASIEVDKQNSKVLQMALSAGASFEDAQKLSSLNCSYEDKIQQIITATATFNADALSTLQGTKPLGGGETPNKDEVNTTSQAVQAVMKEHGINGIQAVQKAKLMYPEIYNKRQETYYGKRL